jgi:hypothetical protein
MGRKRRSGSRERAAPPTKGLRALRPRGTPRWLLKQADLDAIAKQRVLLVLSVLSGEKPVTTAVVESGISRGFYYQLETKALNAMLLALVPGADGEVGPDATGTSRRIADLEQQVTRLAQEKRRAERLLLLTRKTIRPAPVKTAAGRPPKLRSSTNGGRGPSSASPKKPTTPAPPSGSILTPGGGTEGP